MSVLITGSGLIGSQIARLEVERGERPVILDVAPQLEALADIVDISKVKVLQGDVLNPLDLVRVVREEGIRRIIHTAANPLLTSGAQRNPYPAIHLNIMGTVNVLETARVLELERVVLASSAVLYHYMEGGEDRGAAFKEEAYPRPTTFYASTKQAGENLGLNYARWFGVDFAAVRFAAVFGPWRGRGGGGPSNTFRQMIEKVLREEEATFLNRRMEWVYSKDAALGAVLACHASGLKNRVFNIGMGEVPTPAQVVTMVEKAVPGARVRLRSPEEAGPLPAEVEEPMDLTRSREQLGYQPQFPMEKAIEDYVAWYRRQG